jgi:hypothetical protein
MHSKDRIAWIACACFDSCMSAHGSNVSTQARDQKQAFWGANWNKPGMIGPNTHRTPRTVQMATKIVHWINWSPYLPLELMVRSPKNCETLDHTEVTLLQGHWRPNWIWYILCGHQDVANFWCWGVTATNCLSQWPFLAVTITCSLVDGGSLTKQQSAGLWRAITFFVHKGQRLDMWEWQHYP